MFFLKECLDSMSKYAVCNKQPVASKVLNNKHVFCLWVGKSSGLALLHARIHKEIFQNLADIQIPEPITQNIVNFFVSF